jgi:beta-glucosidase-like glycosyl hydrolase/CubicO group peptidase (beta-lactamase class C family)
MRRFAVAVCAASLFWGCRHPREAARPPATPPPSVKVSPWARDTLARMTLPQKAAQMIGVRASGLYGNPRSAERQRLLELVRRGVGCVVVFESEVEALPPLLNALQREAALPLLVAADLERGAAFRIRRGVVPLPYAMALGATGSEGAARFAGEVAAREAKALGIHWAFAPVADVNNNPANPVINIRSFGEDPELVAGMSAAFIAGARSGGLLTTVKHFPGHGDTAVDTHLQLATIPGDRARLQQVELLPFRRAIQAGVDAVMIGHIASPTLDPSGAPATLSQPMVTELLRRELGFRGLVVTDAMEMSGVRAAWTGDAAIRAVRAGADFILLPPDPEVAAAALVRGVREGQLEEARLDESVLRILSAKQRVGLDTARLVDAEAIGKSVGRPEDVERAQQVARASITVLRNRGELLPLRAERPLRLLHLVMSSDVRNELIQGWPEEELQARRVPVRTLTLGPELSEAGALDILQQAGQHSHVLVSAFVRVAASKGTADMLPAHARLIERLASSGTPLVVQSFGSPYLLRQFPEVPAFLAAYGAAESSQRAAVAALFGEFEVTGRLPVTIPGVAARGDGLRIAGHAMALRPARPQDVGFGKEGMVAVDRVVEEFVQQRAFPGAVLAVGKDGALVHLKAFGKHSYDEHAPDVAPDTLYDLASLTKVVATTTTAMMLVDQGRLDLAKPVSAFLPRFCGGDKDTITLWHLLTHSSGVDWWAPLYEKADSKDGYLDLIYAMDLKFAPGTKSVYSDLGILLLGEVLERVAGTPVESFAREHLFAPLSMKDTLFRPPVSLLPRIAPTELDSKWRKRMVHGEVHDENAAGLGGTAPHAGLFGTAPDLARFAQMLLNGGVFEQRRYVSRATVERFVARAGVPDSSRALGWDTMVPATSSGSLLSPRSFGHTGFTGTSMWLDPERNLFVILLTNRVHPTRDNNLIRQARPAVADAVVKALEPR